MKLLLSHQFDTDITEFKYSLMKILGSSFDWVKGLPLQNSNTRIISLEPFMKVQPDIEVEFACEGVRAHKFILYYRCYYSEKVRLLLSQNNLTNIQVSGD
jgi:hypothetical protein